MIRSLLKDLKQGLLDVLYPSKVKCFICGSEVFNPEYGICDKCMESLPFIKPPVCIKCGKPIDNGELCRDCRAQDHEFIQAVSVFEYTGIVKELIHRFKYKGQMYLYEFFACFMYDKLIHQKNWPEFDAVVPVPVSCERLKRRGYNQAELMADYIADKINVDIFPDFIIRNIDTIPQSELNRTERMKNLNNAFEIKTSDKLKNKKVLLVDDIYTTGATVNLCSRRLKNAGVSCVYVITAATGRNS